MAYNWQQPHYRQGRKPRTAVKREMRGSLALGPEDVIQHDYFEWVDTFKGQHPQLACVFAIPNGAAKSRTQAAVMQVTGLRAGVPDVLIAAVGSGSRQVVGDDVQAGPFFAGFFIEFKAPGCYPRPEQREWHERLRAAGYRVEVHRSWITAANATIEYLGLALERIPE